MIPTKNRLAIKQYIRDKPVRWGCARPRRATFSTQKSTRAGSGTALPHAEERAGSPGRGHRHAKPQALPQGTRQEADRTWPVRIPVPGSSVCHRLEGPQAHPLPEQLPRPEESVHCEQACGGPARAVDRATACGGLHQVS